MTAEEEVWLRLPYAEREAIVSHIFISSVCEPGSFRKLIYDKLKFEGSSYESLKRLP